MKSIVLICLSLFFCNILAAEKTLSIALNIGKPWAYYDPDKGVTGIDAEVIQTIFTRLGYKVEFHLFSYNRLVKEFKDGKFDFASPAAFTADNGVLTKKYLPFNDVAISLKSTNITLNNISELKNYRIIAYQYAETVLGKEYRDAIKQAQYLELVDREVQVNLLAHQRTDLVIGERRLLTYIIKELYPEVQLNIHNIFPVTHYGAIAKDKKIAESFNQELNKLTLSGELQKIIDKWQ